MSNYVPAAAIVTCAPARPAAVEPSWAGPGVSEWREPGLGGHQQHHRSNNNNNNSTAMIPEEGFYQPEVFPWNGGYPLTEELAFMKRKVVPFLLNHPYSGPFRYPVNAKAEGIYPDYFKVGNMATPPPPPPPPIVYKPKQRLAIAQAAGCRPLHTWRLLVALRPSVT